MEHTHQTNLWSKNMNDKWVEKNQQKTINSSHFRFKISVEETDIKRFIHFSTVMDIIKNDSSLKIMYCCFTEKEKLNPTFAKEENYITGYIESQKPKSVFNDLFIITNCKYNPESFDERNRMYVGVNIEFVLSCDTPVKNGLKKKIMDMKCNPHMFNGKVTYDRVLHSFWELNPESVKVELVDREK